MKVSSPVNNPFVNSVNGGRTAAAPSTGGSASGKSSVDLSPAARHLASLQNGDNDIDMQRVQQVRDAIAAGQLKVDASRIADSLLASVRELLK